MYPQILAELIIFGDEKFDPTAVSSACGIEADQTWRIGDRIGTSTMKRESNAWVLSTEYTEGLDVATVLRPLLVRAAPARELIRSLARRDGLEVQMSICIQAADVSPAISFEPAIVAELHSLGAGLDIDLILMEA